VLDAKGRKMSKSLGNGIDPIEIIEQYGADALRFMLITGNTPGNDLRFQEERLEAARNFANKLWNACRFAIMNLEDYEEDAYPLQLTLADRWILDRLRQTAAAVNHNLEKYELGEAAREIYDFTWDEFCDWYVETAKARLYKGGAEERHTAQQVLALVLRHILQLLHPFMPFITEELWQHLPHEGRSIMLAPYADGRQLDAYAEDTKKMQLLMEIIRSVRNIRAEMNVPPGKKAALSLFAEAETLAVIEEGAAYIRVLAQVEEIETAAKGSQPPPQAAAAHSAGVEIYVPLKGLIDLDKEAARLQKELAATHEELKRLQGKLNNQGFLAKAPAEVVEKERAKQAEYEEKAQALAARLELFKS
jgi:valyl-tRNA synthetase